MYNVKKSSDILFNLSLLSLIKNEGKLRLTDAINNVFFQEKDAFDVFLSSIQ